MTRLPPPPPPPDTGAAHGSPPDGEDTSGPRRTREEMRDLGRLRRPVEDRMVAGVCAGLARHFDVDPVLVRVAMVVLALFGGSGLLLYAASWVLLPEEGTDHHPLGLDDRNRGIALVGVVVLAVLALLGEWSGAFWFPWPLVVVALLAFLVLAPGRQRRSRTEPAAPGEHPPPQRPRKPGPILFWPTLAVLALGIGALGVVDLAGPAVPGSAYPALVLGITGVVLVLGAFWGRPGGLIALGLVAAVATAGATVLGHVEAEERVVRPERAALLAEHYQFRAGRLVLDLTDVSDLEELDGEEVSVRGNAGEIEVLVPQGLSLDVTADVHGPGEVRLFPGPQEGDGRDRFRDDDGGGFSDAEREHHDAGPATPTLDLDLDLDLGAVVVHEQ